MSFMDKLGTDAIIDVCGEKAKDGTKYVMNKVLGNKEDEKQSDGGPGLSTLMNMAGGSGGVGGLKIPGVGNLGGDSGGDDRFSLPGLDTAGGDSGGDCGLKELGAFAKKRRSLSGRLLFSQLGHHSSLKKSLSASFY